ncbi:hypothetical protein ACVBEH_12740 [Roseateles sp. GG27B]
MAKIMSLGKHPPVVALLLGLGCQACLAQSPAGKALLEQGVYWQAQGNIDRAAEAWKKLLRLQPDESRALYGLAQISWHRSAAAVLSTPGAIAKHKPPRTLCCAAGSGHRLKH